MANDQIKASLFEKSLSLLVFFDLFERPLTLWEIRDNLDRSASLIEIEASLAGRPDLIQQKNGFYFLSGREETIATRQKRYNYTRRKLKIARRYARVFGVWPGVRAVCLANSIGSNNLRDGSDIDLFIITAPKRIWTTRFFCAGLTKVLGQRPTAKNKRDKICLSFYVSAEHLNLSDLMLTGGDPYFYYWLRSLVLLYNKKRTYERFLAANGLGPEIEMVGVEKNSFMGAALERWLKIWQIKILPPALKASSGMVWRDDVLKLYTVDRRQEFLDNFNQQRHARLEKNN